MKILCFILFIACISTLDIPYLPEVSTENFETIRSKIHLSIQKMKNDDDTSYPFKCRNKNTNKILPSLHHLIPKRLLSGYFYKTMELMLKYADQNILEIIIHRINNILTNHCELLNKNLLNKSIDNIYEGINLFFRLFLWVPSNVFPGPLPRKRLADSHEKFDVELYQSCSSEIKAKYKIFDGYLNERDKEKEIIQEIIQTNFDIDSSIREIKIAINNHRGNYLSQKYNYLLNNYLSYPRLLSNYIIQDHERLVKTKIFTEMIIECLNLFSFDLIEKVFQVFGTDTLSKGCDISWELDQTSQKYYIRLLEKN